MIHNSVYPFAYWNKHHHAFKIQTDYKNCVEMKLIRALYVY